MGIKASVDQKGSKISPDRTEMRSDALWINGFVKIEFTI